VEITESCLDAETLAAWVDGGLSAPELERAQTHVAGCVRCQTMIGTLARITAAAPVAKTEAAPRHWRAWLVPLTAAAAAVTIWVAIPGSKLDTRVPIPPASPVYAPEPKAELPVPPPAPRQKAQAPAPAVQSPQPPAPERAKEERADAAVPPPTALDKIAPQAETVTVTGVAPSAAPSEAPPPMPPAAPVAPTLRGPGGAAGGVVAGAAGRGGGGAGARAQAGAASGTLSESIRLADRSAFSSPAVIVSPDPMIRWRIAGNDVERSVNGGFTWETTRTGVSTPLTAGAAPSPTVVWVVGESGVVLVSTDGRTWRRVPFTPMTNLSSIRARDARSVQVTAADGRIFSTTDAGATWIPGPLQGF
jgi:hypothetical protein